MKTREIIIYSLLFLISSLVTIDIVMSALVNRRLVELPALQVQGKETFAISSECSDKEPIESLAASDEPHLQKLAVYQKACDSFVTDTLMIFTDMPKDESGAREAANKITPTLQEFSKHNVHPLVVVEPVTEWGLIDFTEFRGGFYDAWIEAYFSQLKQNGLTNEQMGTWVPFPEANLPYWNHANATPQDFSAVVNKYLATMKKHFPKANGSVLLNSATYETTDFEWVNGEYISLAPYVKDLKKELIDSFGLQGFSWSPPATITGPGVFDASEYLNYRLAKEAADTIGTKNIWYNTGSFGRKYTADPERTVSLSPEKRKDVLTGIISESIRLRDAGYNISINLFAQDKSGVAEATDWSYWQNNDPSSSAHTDAFVNFAARLREEKINLWLFDL